MVHGVRAAAAAPRRHFPQRGIRGVRPPAARAGTWLERAGAGRRAGPLAVRRTPCAPENDPRFLEPTNPRRLAMALSVTRNIDVAVRAPEMPRAEVALVRAGLNRDPRVDAPPAATGALACG